MLKTISSFFLTFCSIFLCLAQPSNTNTSNGVTFDGEPFLAISSLNNQNMVAAWMGFKYTNGFFKIAIKTRASFDGGNTWSAINILPHFGKSYGSADVSMAFDKNGLLYLCYIDYRQAPDSGGIYVVRSKDGGLQWDTPSKAFDMYDVAGKRPIDRPWLVVDQNNTGTIYVTAKPAPWIPPPNRNYYKVSTDSGHTWSAIANIDGGSYLVGGAIAQPMAAPACAKNGNFYAVYPSYVSSQNILPAYYLATSSDNGKNFTYSTVLAAIPAAIDTNFKSGYCLLANPVDGNKMVFLLVNAANGDPDIVALNTNDGGQIWSNPIRVNDDTKANGKAQDMVWGAYNEKGNLVVTWRDRRSASANGFWNAGYDFYYAISADNGKTFSANNKLSSQYISFDSILTASGNDFMGCVYNGDTLCTLWGDTRTGKMNIFFTKTIASTNTNVGVTFLDNKESVISLYPNPTEGILTIHLPTIALGTTLYIYTANGLVVQKFLCTKTTENINTKELKKGVYFLQIGQEILRFIKE